MLRLGSRLWGGSRADSQVVVDDGVPGPDRSKERIQTEIARKREENTKDREGGERKRKKRAARIGGRVTCVFVASSLSIQGQ